MGMAKDFFHELSLRRWRCYNWVSHGAGMVRKKWFNLFTNIVFLFVCVDVAVVLPLLLLFGEGCHHSCFQGRGRRDWTEESRVREQAKREEVGGK